MVTMAAITVSTMAATTMAATTMAAITIGAVAIIVAVTSATMNVVHRRRSRQFYVTAGKWSDWATSSRKYSSPFFILNRFYTHQSSTTIHRNDS